MKKAIINFYTNHKLAFYSIFTAIMTYPCYGMGKRIGEFTYYVLH